MEDWVDKPDSDEIVTAIASLGRAGFARDAIFTISRLIVRIARASDPRSAGRLEHELAVLGLLPSSVITIDESAYASE